MFISVRSISEKNECSFEDIKKLSDQQENYFKLLDDIDKDQWNRAVRYEDCLLRSKYIFAII